MSEATKWCTTHKSTVRVEICDTAFAVTKIDGTPNPCNLGLAFVVENVTEEEAEALRDFVDDVVLPRLLEAH